MLTLDMSNYIGDDNIFLSFDFYNIRSSASLNDSIWIRGSPTDNWIGLYDWQGQDNGVWLSSPELDIDATLIKAGQNFSKNFQIRFGQDGYFSAYADGLLLDNIFIGNCSRPTDLSATNLTTTSAELGWTELGATTNWDIELGVKGFLQGNGVKIIGTSDNPYSLSSLIPATAYDFYVRANCDETISEWVGPYTFSTNCPNSNPITLPFIEDFEDTANVTFTGNGKICKMHGEWDYQTIEGQARFGTNAPINNGGTGALLLDGTYESSINDALLMLDMSNYIGASNVFLSFDFYDASDGESPNDSIWIRGSQSDEWVGLYNWQGQTERAWIRTPELDIATTLINAGQAFSASFQIRFGQEGYYPYSSDGLAIDNILINDCSRPNALKATKITANSADLNWNALGSSSTWEIEWGVKNFLQGNGVKVEGVDINTYALSNLFPATSFDFYVRSNCDGLLTEWAGPHTFTTLCPSTSPVSLPFIEDFENIANITFEIDKALCMAYGSWRLETTDGRARFGTESPINNGGLGALLLDGGSSYNYSTNDAILTLDMFNYLNATNLFLSFDFYDVGNSNNPNDSIWIRGSNADVWVGLYSWQRQIEYNWITTPELDLDATLANAGQTFSQSFQIRFGQQGYSSYSSDGLILDNLYIGSCSTPDTLAATNIKTTSADLSWKKMGTATTWDIEWGQKGINQGNGTVITGVTTNPYSLQNLEAGIFYDFYVRANCDGIPSNWAGPFTFNTLCAPSNPITLPFIEDFENITDTTFTADGLICNSDKNWTFQEINGRARFGMDAPINNGGAGALFLDGNSSENNAIMTLDMSNYIGTTEVVLNFDFYDANDNFSPNDKIWIRGSDTSTWITLYNWQGQKENTWITLPEFDLDVALANAGQTFSKSFQIRFGQAGLYPYSSDGLGVDNIYIGSCPKPDTLVATDITSTSIELSWKEMSTATTWDIEWGPKGISQGNGTVITGVTTNSYKLQNLEAGLFYDFYARSDCDGMPSNWAGPFTLYTLCTPMNPITLPFIEDFEDITDTTFTTDKLICNSDRTWTYQAVGGRARFGINAPLNNGGSGALLLDNNYNFNTNDAILTLNMSNYTGATNVLLSFDFYDAGNPNSLNDSIWIRGSNTDSWVGLYDWRGQVEYTWITTPELDVDVVLTSVGQSFSNSFQIRFGQSGYYPYSSDGLAVDNIYIGACPKPDTLTATNITTTSADLSWKEMGTATTWDIEWGPRGINQGNGTVITGVTTNPYSLQNLEAGIFYDFYVRANCDGIPSNWAGPFTFTPSNPITLPFIEDFENITSTTLTENGLVCTIDGTWTYATTRGRAQFGMAAPINNGGSGALLLDNPNGSSTNDATLTLDMSNYINATNVSLTFDFYDAGDETSLNDRVWIRGRNSDNWLEIFNWQGNQESTWILSPKIDIDSVLASGGQTFSSSFQIRFGQEDNVSFSSDGLIIDNITINGPAINTCLSPSGLTANNITSFSVDLAWTDIDTSKSWEIEWDTTGFTQGTGTLASNIDTNVYNLLGLTIGRSYDFYVRSNCDTSNSSIWAGPFTFETIQIYPPNYIQDFENYTLDFDWEGQFQIGQLHNNFSKVLFDDLSVDRDLTVTTPLIGPIASGDWLAFNYQYLEVDSLKPTILGEGDTLHVQISTDYGNSFTTIDQIHAGNHVARTDMAQLNYDLSEFSGEIVKVRIFAEWGTGFYYLSIDNFFIGKANVSILDASTVEGAEGSTADLRFNILLDTAYPNIISVDYTSVDSTATLAEADYTETKGQLTFLPGEIDKEIIIPIKGDNRAELQEIVQLKLSNPVLAILTNSIGFGFIEDDDFNEPMAEANANEDQLNVCDTIVQLDAILGMNAPLGWRIISGTGGVLMDEVLSNAIFTEAMGEMYELEWTVNSPLGQAGRDTVLISFNPDTDNDGIQDCKDICPNEDDTIDSDGDTQPDACDCNPNDATDSLLVVSNNHPDNRISDSTYQSSVKLIGKGKVKNQSTVVFKAGQEILLSAGFHAESGSNFQALIAPCEPNQNLEEPIPIAVNSRQQLNQSTNVEVLDLTNPVKMIIRPNLIRQAATIQIDLPDKMVVSLRLYNANGQEMEVYLTEVLWEEGTHLLQFIRGNLPSGIYFLQLRSEKGVLTKRLLVQR